MCKQLLGYLSSATNSSLPSWLCPILPGASPAFSACSDGTLLLARLISLQGFFGNLSMCENKKCIFILFKHPEFLEGFYNTANEYGLIYCLCAPQEVVQHVHKRFPLAHPSVFKEFFNSLSFMSCRICGQSQMPAFIFSMLGQGKVW